MLPLAAHREEQGLKKEGGATGTVTGVAAAVMGDKGKRKLEGEDEEEEGAVALA